jgi:hypothetical protein
MDEEEEKSEEESDSPLEDDEVEIRLKIHPPIIKIERPRPTEGMA